MKKADASGAWLALIVGEDEVKSAQVSVKSLRKNEEQARVARDSLLGNFEALVRKART
jgi:histidyl-tRNA synthetase